MALASPPGRRLRTRRSGQRRRVVEVHGLGLDRVDDGMAQLALARLDGLEDEQPQRQARLLDPQQLAGDERLRHAREAHEHVADGSLVSTHRPRDTPGHANVTNW